ncbi:MAG: TraY domain-containing protein [Nitrospinae bacterium]|nr:TraY domain-containing protein [Nitrospinota bacterium]
MLALRLTKETEKRLGQLAKKTGRTKSHYAKKAIEEFLDEWEDYLIALSRMEKKHPSIPLEEIERRLGLEG